jgi:hypothetical protein
MVWFRNLVAVMVGAKWAPQPTSQIRHSNAIAAEYLCCAA